jgi:hypothetical protein
VSAVDGAPCWGDRGVSERFSMGEDSGSFPQNHQTISNLHLSETLNLEIVLIHIVLWVQKKVWS